MVFRKSLQLLTTVSLIIIVTANNPPADVEPTEITDEGPDNIVAQMKFIDELYDMTRNIGREALLSCRVHGAPPMNLYIMHDRIQTWRNKQKKRNLPSETIYDPRKPNELAVVYRIENLKEKHEGVYKCQAESITGEVAVSAMTLTLVDPCDGVECGFMQECVNVKGRGICTCDYDCDETYNPVCSDQITFSSMCHLKRSQCREGALADDISPGACPDVGELPTKANCSLSGEGHVSMFNGDYFTFRGQCPYKMVEDTRGGNFIVYAMTERCGDDNAAQCLRSITIYVDRIYGFSIERGWQINDNGRRRNVMNGEQIILGGGAVSITRSGKTLVGRIENKQIMFFYDGLQYFKLSVPLDFVTKYEDFAGVCGPIPVDHVPSVGRDISSVSDVSMPSLGSEELCRPEFGPPECSNPEIFNQVKDVFNNNAEIRACAAVVPAELYITRAAIDTCTTDHNKELNYGFCNVLYAYAEDCRQAGVEFSFSEVGSLCQKSFHKDVFKSEGVSYNRRRWYHNNRKRGH